MLNIACVECGKKYQVDETNMKGTSGRVRCKACGKVMLIINPRAEAKLPKSAVENPLAVSDDIPAIPEVHDHPPETVPPSVVDRAGVLASQYPTEPERDILPFVNRQKVRTGLFSKISIAMLIASLLPLAVFWGITFRETRNRVRLATEDSMAQSARALDTEIDGWINNNVLILRTAANMPEIASMDGARQEKFLKVIQQEYPWMHQVFTLNPAGINVAKSDDRPLEDYSDRQYYKDILAGNKLSWQTLIDKASQKPTLVLAVPIQAGDKLLGALAASMSIDEISKNIGGWRKGQTGFAFLIDENGFVLSHPDMHLVSERQNFNSHPLIADFHKNGSRTMTSSFNAANGEEAIGHVTSNNYGWTLVLQQQKNEIFDFFNQAQEFAFILLAGAILLVLIIAWICARAIVRPITDLTDAVELMSVGELNVTIDTKSKNEIGLLARAIERLQTSL